MIDGRARFHIPKRVTPRDTTRMTTTLPRFTSSRRMSASPPTASSNGQTASVTAVAAHAQQPASANHWSHVRRPWRIRQITTTAPRTAHVACNRCQSTVGGTFTSTRQGRGRGNQNVASQAQQSTLIPTRAAELRLDNRPRRSGRAESRCIRAAACGPRLRLYRRSGIEGGADAPRPHIEPSGDLRPRQAGLLLEPLRALKEVSGDRAGSSVRCRGPSMASLRISWTPFSRSFASSDLPSHARWFGIRHPPPTAAECSILVR